MKKIPLSVRRGENRDRYFALVDDDDYEEISKNYWFLSCSGYAVRKGKEKLLYIHRAILNAKDGQICDHINRDRLDNRKENLRICTRAENARNRGLGSTNTSGFVGVSLFKNKWMTRICVDNSSVFLGYFDNKEDAARAYNEAALKYHGEFAYQNKV